MFSMQTYYKQFLHLFASKGDDDGAMGALGIVIGVGCAGALSYFIKTSNNGTQDMYRFPFVEGVVFWSFGLLQGFLAFIVCTLLGVKIRLETGYVLAGVLYSGIGFFLSPLFLFVAMRWVFFTYGDLSSAFLIVRILEIISNVYLIIGLMLLLLWLEAGISYHCGFSGIQAALFTFVLITFFALSHYAMFWVVGYWSLVGL